YKTQHCLQESEECENYSLVMGLPTALRFSNKLRLASVGAAVIVFCLWWVFHPRGNEQESSPSGAVRATENHSPRRTHETSRKSLPKPGNAAEQNQVAGASEV